MSLSHMRLPIQLEAELDGIGETDNGEYELKCYTINKRTEIGSWVDHFDMTGHVAPYYYHTRLENTLSDHIWDEKHELFNKILEQVRLDYPNAVVLLKQLHNTYSPEQASWKLGVQVKKKNKKKNDRDSDSD